MAAILAPSLAASIKSLTLPPSLPVSRRGALIALIGLTEDSRDGEPPSTAFGASANASSWLRHGSTTSWRKTLTSLSGLPVGSTPVTSTAWIWLTWLRMASSWPAKLSSSSSVRARRARRARWATSSREICDTIEQPSHHADRGSPPSAGMLSRRACATVLRVPSYLLRVQLEDRPGSLGSLAVALGSVGADILSLDVVERASGYAIDDLVVELPAGAMPDMLITAAEKLDGVYVDAIRPHTGLLEAHRELELIDHIAAPTASTSSCRCWPTKRPMCCAWVGALCRADRVGAERIVGSPGAPETQAADTPWLPLDHAAALDATADWVPRYGAIWTRRWRRHHWVTAARQWCWAGRADLDSGRRRWPGWATWPASSQRSCADSAAADLHRDRRFAGNHSHFRCKTSVSASGVAYTPSGPYSSSRRKPSSSRIGTPSSTALSYFEPGESPATT